MAASTTRMAAAAMLRTTVAGTSSKPHSPAQTVSPPNTMVRPAVAR